MSFELAQLALDFDDALLEPPDFLGCVVEARAVGAHVTGETRVGGCGDGAA